jgi:hypothetical protein
VTAAAAARWAVAAVAALVPAVCWIWEPPSPALAIVLRSIAFFAAVHGLGRLAGAIAGDDEAPVTLAMVWGTAVYLALAGVLLAAHGFGVGGRTALVVGGAAIGAGWIARRTDTLARQAERWGPRALVVGAVAAGCAVFVVLAAGGHWQGAFTDGDTDYLGQVRRLADTGALADGVGFPRVAGLGGQLALASIVDTIDPRAAHLADRGIMLLLAIALAMTARRRHASGVALAVIPVFLLALPGFPDDASPRWSLVVLFVGAVQTLERAHARQSHGNAVLALLVLAAAVTLRHAALGGAVVMAIAIASGGWGGRPRASTIILVFAAVLAPYLAAAALAGAGDGSPAFTGFAHGLVPRTAITAAAGLVLGLLFAAATPGSTTRTGILALAAGAALIGPLSPSLATAIATLVAFGLAMVVLLLVGVLADPADAELVGIPVARPTLGSLTIVATLLIGALALARFPTGALAPWPSRLLTAINDVRALGETPRGPRSALARRYAEALALVPPGEPVAIAVDRPDLVDHAARTVVDVSRRPIGPRGPRLLLTDRAPPEGAIPLFDRRGLVLVELSGPH